MASPYRGIKGVRGIKLTNTDEWDKFEIDINFNNQRSKGFTEDQFEQLISKLDGIGNKLEKIIQLLRYSTAM
jgi:hypothetical protein